MSRRDWRHHTPVGVGLAIILALVLAASIRGADQRYRATCGNEATAEKERQIANGCGRTLPIVGEPKSPPRDENPKREEWRQEKDLEAQEQMAQWALGSMIAAFMSAFATGIGIYFLKQTLDATKVALREAERSSNAAVAMARAMVGIELPVIQAQWLSSLTSVREPVRRGEPYGGLGNSSLPEKHSVISSIPFRNYGRTPAFPMSISLGFCVAGQLPDIPNYTDHVSINPDLIMKPEPRENAFDVDIDFTVSMSEAELAALEKEEAQFWFFCALFYADFMGEPHEARYCWRWAQRPKGHGIYHFDCDGDPPVGYTRRT